MRDPSRDMLRGTLDLLVLQSVEDEELHGWAISERIQTRSREVLKVGQGALYPALHRLERRGLLSSSWALSENNRRARYYHLTAKGRRHLEAERRGWDRFTEAVGLVLGER